MSKSVLKEVQEQLKKFVPICELLLDLDQDSTGCFSAKVCVSGPIVSILLQDGRFTCFRVYDPDRHRSTEGVVGGYSQRALEVAEAAEMLGLVRKGASSKFRQWFFATSDRNCAQAEIQKAKELLERNGHRVVKP